MDTHSSRSTNIKITENEKVDLIKDLVDTVRSKQQLDQSLNEHRMMKQLKSQKQSQVTLNRYQSDKESLCKIDIKDNNFDNGNQAKITNSKRVSPQKILNVDPMRLTQKIAKNKKDYHVKLHQFDAFIKQREILQQRENERMAIELQKLQKDKEEHEKQLQEILSASIPERNAWFHKYSKSNLTQRKQKILDIHKENKKIVKRLLDIKPHPDMLLLAKQTQPIDLNTNNYSNGQKSLNNTMSNLKTQRDFVKDNKFEQGQDVLSRLSSLTPSYIPREKSSLSFVKDQLDVIKEVTVLPTNIKSQHQLNGNLTQRSFYQRKDSTNLTLTNYNKGQNHDTQQTRPSTTTTANAVMYQRPRSSLLVTQKKRISEFKLPYSIRKQDSMLFDQQESNNDKVNYNQGQQFQLQLLKQGSLTQRDNNNDHNNSISIHNINIDISSQTLQQNQTQQQAFAFNPITQQYLNKSVEDLEIEHQQKKSVQRFKRLLDASQPQFLPKQVSVISNTQKQKFINQQVWIDPESYQNNKTERLQRKMSEYSSKSQFLDSSVGNIMGQSRSKFIQKNLQILQSSNRNKDIQQNTIE